MEPETVPEYTFGQKVLGFFGWGLHATGDGLQALGSAVQGGLETAGGYFAERAEDETLSNVVRQLFDAAENRSCKGYVPC